MSINTKHLNAWLWGEMAGTERDRNMAINGIQRHPGILTCNSKKLVRGKTVGKGESVPLGTLFKRFINYSSLIYYIPTAVSPSSSSPSSSLSPPLFFRSIPPLFPFRKEQASQGYQPNMAKQISIKLGTSPHIKAG